MGTIDDQIAKELCSTKGGSWAAMHCNNVHIPNRLRSALQVHLLHVAASRCHKRPRERQASLRPAKRGTAGPRGSPQLVAPPVVDMKQALLTAVVTGTSSSELQQLVQQAGADVNQLFAQGRSLLHAAAEAGQAGSCSALLDLGADMWLNDQSGVSPMMLAAKHGYHGVVKVLLDAGADPFQVDQSGTNALLLAAACGSADCIKLLLQEGYVDADYHNSDLGGGEHALLLAAEGGLAECVKLLLDAGAKANRADKEGRTALWVASRAGHLPVVQLLLSQPCIKHVCHFISSTSPIQEAQAAGHAAIVSLLAAHLAQQQELPELPELPAVGKQRQRQGNSRAQDGIKRLQQRRQQHWQQQHTASSQAGHQQQQQLQQQARSLGQQQSSSVQSNGKKQTRPSSSWCVAAAVTVAGHHKGVGIASLHAADKAPKLSPVALAY